VVENERRRREKSRKAALEVERKRLIEAVWASYAYQKRYGYSGPLIDFSAIAFSPADLERVEIPGNLVSIEDQTLAYCVKYWNLIEDSAFERILFLYSRKYGKRNYDAYMALRRGRLGKQRDDELLASVMSSLVKGYYYSIKGDRYLQRRWAFIKTTLNQAPASRPRRERKPRGKGPEREGRKASGKRSLPERRTGPHKTGLAGRDLLAGAGEPKRTAPVREAVKKVSRLRPAGRRLPPGAAPAAPAAAAEKAAAKGKAVRAGKAVPARAQRKAGALKTGSAARAAAVKKARRELPQRVPASAGGSVSDRLRILSGRSYDLYQERFLSQARFAIRKIMETGRGIFFTLPEGAEDIIYNFLKVHYADPLMNWAESGERKTLAEMGFELSTLNPIIDECYRRL
jgi:hypothetical protein